MKTFNQFVESYAEKMAIARQKQLDHVAKQKQRSQNAVSSLQAKRDAEEKRNKLKREIKQEIEQGDFN
ncbi:MAG: hypothetical protein EBU90_31135 [Proteobacteria bacterium]|nr:hypothetical protein [Pseudomonadota bacterium]